MDTKVMTLKEALDVAIDSATGREWRGDVERTKAATVLTRFRDQGLPEIEQAVETLGTAAQMFHSWEQSKRPYDAAEIIARQVEHLRAAIGSDK